MKGVGMLQKVFLPLFCLLSYGCSTISPFSEQAYKNVIDVKVDAWTIMGKATESYATHRSEIDNFNSNLRKAYEFDKNRPLNVTTVQQWDILMNPNEHLLGGFMADWQKKDKMGRVYVTFKQKQVGSAFDEIAQLEAGKIRQK